jgi:hypothetical protein
LGTIEGAATTYGRLRVGIAVPAGALVSHGEEGGERGGEELGNERKGGKQTKRWAGDEEKEEEVLGGKKKTQTKKKNQKAE